MSWFGSNEKTPGGNGKPLHAARIEDYALIGDCETAALVSREGSIDWLCWPDFASPACFAALLGTADNGYWRLAPAVKNFAKEVSVERHYRPRTMILETTFTVGKGVVTLIDFMPPRGKFSDVIRIVRGVSGHVKMRMDLALRFDYGRTVPWVTAMGSELRAVAGPRAVTLRHECFSGSKAELRGENFTTISEFEVKAGDELCFVMTSSSSTAEPPPHTSALKELADTEAHWSAWAARSNYEGKYEEAVERSLMTLEALTYRPTGGMVAAPTMGLPEAMGGERNWDYRYCWLRDTSFTLLVLMRAGYTEEAQRWRGWLLRAVAGAPEQVQSLYGLNGERQVTEWTADWLRGYGESRPVRVGNAASEQFQLDVFGEVIAALHRAPDAGSDIRTPAGELFGALVDHVCKVWDQPDEGIWEPRDGRKHYVHSKVMAWVALDRGIQDYERFGCNGDLKRWRKNRDMLHAEICSKGFSKKRNAFTQSFGSDALDAACLLLPLVGFLPGDDPRIVGTVDAIQKHLMQDGLVLRYDTEKSPDGLRGTEGTFLACSFWLVTALYLSGRKQEATELFERLLLLRNDVGLMSEEYDPKAGRMLGNFPQALSHIALVTAAFTLAGKIVTEGHLADNSRK